jgi:hypothetical protein
MPALSAEALNEIRKRKILKKILLYGEVIPHMVKDLF